MVETLPAPLLARLARDLPLGAYWYEPKWDGFRCLAAVRGRSVALASRHGRPLARYFPEIASALVVLGRDAILDGELVVFRGQQVVAKADDLRFQPGRRAMVKVKTLRTAECVVAGFRAVPGARAVASLLLGLYQGPALRHVGVVASFPEARRRALFEVLSPRAVPLEGHPWQRGFNVGASPLGRLGGSAGRWDPRSMELDWTPLSPELVCGVTFDQLDGARLRHPAQLLRWRPDREAAGCRARRFQINCPPGRPDWVPVAVVPGAGGKHLRYCRLEEPAALAWAAGTGAIELHPFLAAADRPRAPLGLAFDLDPGPEVGLVECCRVALAIRALLAPLGLEAVAKTSGRSGMHVVVPLDGSQSFELTRAFARAVAEQLEADGPVPVAARLPRAERDGDLFRVALAGRQRLPASHAGRGRPPGRPG